MAAGPSTWDDAAGDGSSQTTPTTKEIEIKEQNCDNDDSCELSPSKTSLNITVTEEKVDTTTITTGRSEKYPELDDLFVLHGTIGHGGFSKVKVATDLFTGNKVAVKIVDKEQVGTELHRIDLEVETLQPLNHPHVCKLFSVIVSKPRIFMIMEYCPTDLYEHIVRQDELLPVNEARRIFTQLISAVAYLHSNGIVHRDLKPENVLLDRSMNVKLTDFGLCAVPGKLEINKPTLKTLCGSPAYCAPELLRNPPYIGSKVDVWSLGVMLFVLLVRELPFYCKNVKILYKKIQDGYYTLPSWLSENAKDLINRMLEPNTDLRPYIHSLWSHPWIQDANLDLFAEQIRQSAAEVEEIAKIKESQQPIRTVPQSTSRHYSYFSSSFSDGDDHYDHTEAADISNDNHHDKMNVVAYLETGQGGDALVNNCRKSRILDKNRNSTSFLNGDGMHSSTMNETENYNHHYHQTSRNVGGWVRHAFTKTKNALRKCIPLKCGVVMPD